MLTDSMRIEKKAALNCWSENYGLNEHFSIISNNTFFCLNARQVFLLS